MIEIDPEISEFRIRHTDRRRISTAKAFLPLLSCFSCILPPLRKRLCSWVNELFDYYARLAYLFDEGDVGFFESFIIDNEEMDEILQDLQKRANVWKKDCIMQSDTGVHPDLDNLNSLNMRCSMSDKKQAALRLVSRKGETIKYFGKRVERQDPEFYNKINALWLSFCQKNGEKQS